MKLFWGFLFLASCSLLIHNVIAPVEESSTPRLEVFFEQQLRTEFCVDDSATPIWSIDGYQLISATDIQSYNAKVERNNTGVRQARLIINRVNYTLNGSVISCSASSTPLLTYTLVVVNTTIKWLELNDMFRPPICKSLLAKSLAPYWMINEVVLNSTTVNHRYDAEVRRPYDNKNGKRQAELRIRSVNITLNGSRISCFVGSELRMMYILYIIRDTEEDVATTGSAVNESATTTSNATDVSSGNLKDSIVIGVSVPILLVLAVTALGMAGCVYLTKTGRIFKKCKTADTKLNVLELHTCILDHNPVDSTAVEEITHPSNALVMSRRQYGQPVTNVQRGMADGGIEGAADGGHVRNQDVRPHLENLFTERDVPDSGTSQGQGIPEENQGEGHAAAKVFGKVSVQNFPNGPLKIYLTDKEILKEEQVP